MNMIDTMSRTFQFCLVVFIGVLWRSYEMRGFEIKKALELVCTYLWCTVYLDLLTSRAFECVARL